MISHPLFPRPPRPGLPSCAPTRVVPAADAEHLPDIILVVPGRITYDHDGHDPEGRHIYRERVTE